MVLNFKALAQIVRSFGCNAVVRDEKRKEEQMGLIEVEVNKISQGQLAKLFHTENMKHPFSHCYSRKNSRNIQTISIILPLIIFKAF